MTPITNTPTLSPTFEEPPLVLVVVALAEDGDADKVEIEAKVDSGWVLLVEELCGEEEEEVVLVDDIEDDTKESTEDAVEDA